MTTKYAPLIDAAMEIKLEATTAHLWFEEIMSGDRDESIKNVILGIERSAWYVNAMLKGGHNNEGTFEVVKDKILITKLKTILTELKEFKKLTDERYTNFAKSGSGSLADKEYDSVFNKLIENADEIETQLQKVILVELKAYKTTYYILLLIFLILTLIISFTLLNYERKIRELSMKDPLTKHYNRLYMENIFDIELERAKRYGKAFSIIFVDIDYFKDVNDKFGHSVGDTVLKEISNIFKSNIRCVDTIARWGGEEFIIICPETDIKTAETIADKLRRAVESYKIKLVGYKTCSFGVSQYCTEDEQVSKTIERADNALYEAKNGGRNQVVSK